MHMANELLSVPVAAGTCAVAAGGLGLICRAAKKVITSQKLALMGVLGAFVFAAQMVNFQLPAMPGTSGHIVGAVLLAVILGPHLAAIVISSVVIIQCLIFQDGGLLALGCNIINMGLVPVYVGYFVYTAVAAGRDGRFRNLAASVLACVSALEAGAVLVVIESALSGVLLVPFSTFLITMVSVHFLVGLVEGLITAAVLVYIRQVRADIITAAPAAYTRLTMPVFLITLLVAAVVIGAGLSLVASGMPDGLEWSYAERPDQPGFEPVVSNNSDIVAAADDLQDRYTLMPDYTKRSAALGTAAEAENSAGAGWTSFAAVFGSIVTMLVIWLAAKIIKGAR
jgi:cobalt/nickel transport system permease protein